MGVLAPERGVTKEDRRRDAVSGGVGSDRNPRPGWDPHRRRAGAGFRATGAGLQGVSVPVTLIASSAPRRTAFAVDLVISGTQRLQFLPFAESTHVHLISPWPSPSFSGAFSPGAAPQVGPNGFTADWRVLQINRDYPAVWADGGVSDAQIEKFRVRRGFYQPVDAYQRDYRATHYAVLFNRAHFMALFLWSTRSALRFTPCSTG